MTTLAPKRIPVRPTLAEPANIEYTKIFVTHGQEVKKNDNIATVLVNGVEQNLYAPETGKISNVNRHYLNKTYSSDKVGDIATIEVATPVPDDLKEKIEKLRKTGNFSHIDPRTGTAIYIGENWEGLHRTPISIDQALAEEREREEYLKKYQLSSENRWHEQQERDANRAEFLKKSGYKYYDPRHRYGGKTKHRIHRKSKKSRKHKSRKHKSRKNHKKSLHR